MNESKVSTFFLKTDPLSHDAFYYYEYGPVVSSTFASIQRMFGNLGPGSIPWLFIDEAGQAVPQAAAGAIWRCKRAVVVGDPFQISPVVTTPDTLVKDLGEHFGLTQEQFDSSLSVQRMADRMNRYGWTMNKT